jgi:hypothetical protein
MYHPVRFNTAHFHFIQAVYAAKWHDHLIIFTDFYARINIPFTGGGSDGQETGKDVQEHFKESLHAA